MTEHRTPTRERDGALVIEKLTDELRTLLMLAGHEGPAALRVIDQFEADRFAWLDQMKALQAKCDAQGAVIERVRARYNAMPAMWNFEALKRFARETMADIEQWPSDDEALAAAPEESTDRAECGCCPSDASPPCVRISGRSHMQAVTDIVFGAAKRTLAAAPEHTGWDDPYGAAETVGDLRQLVDSWASKFSAANARVAELEARIRELETPMAWKSERDAAIARAEAAERRASDEERWARLESSRADIAEVHERELRALQLTHEAEAAALREQLAAANALLAAFEQGMLGKSPLRDRVKAQLSNQAQARTDHAVLMRFKARYNALPAIPSASQWKACCVDTMADLENWPRDDVDEGEPATPTAEKEPSPKAIFAAGWCAGRDNPRMPVDVMIDRAVQVLKASREVPAQDLRDIIDSPPPSQRMAAHRAIKAWAEAELARRENEGA